MRTILICASLLANVALALGLARHPQWVAQARDFFGPAATAATTAPAAAANRAGAAAPRPQLWSTVRADDLRSLVARLRAAGFPANVIREIVQARVNQDYQRRLQALQEPDPATPFWKLKPTYFMVGDKRLEEMGQLQRERARQLRELLGDEFFTAAEGDSNQRRQYGSLPRAKIDQVQRIEDDYAEMTSAVRAATNGIVLPEDQEKLALLQREKQKDLAAILSPEELADYQVRSSPMTQLLRSRLGDFEPTEAEFKAIFQAQQAFSDRFQGGFNSVDFQTRQQAEQALAAQLQTGLGDARYADYLRETNSEFQVLNRIAQRENVSHDVAVQAFSLRAAAAQESTRIFDDPNLSVEQKRTSLAALAQNTRAQLTAVLGPAAGPAYVKSAESWLTPIEQGSAMAVAGSPSTMTFIGTGGTMTAFSYSSSPRFRRLPPARPGP